MKPNTRERFWALVIKSGPIPAHRPELGPCWIFFGHKVRGGYGGFKLSQPRREVRAHRLGYYLQFGRWPQKNCCHHCDTPACVRGSHLFDGTHKQNMQDAAAKGRVRNAAAWHYGERHGRHKLTVAQVRAIRKRRAGGERLHVIAADYGVVYQTIQRIIEGKNWRRIA
jgi:hypothetical protein